MVLLIAGIAAATFVVSYAGVRDLAVSAGVPWRLARLYPAILDGVLVVACTAAFVLRDDTSVWRRLWAWVATAILVGIIGAADAIHAMGVNLPHRPAEGTIAALPWAVVMLGFSLWLTMLRYARAVKPAAVPELPADLTPSTSDEAPILPSRAIAAIGKTKDLPPLPPALAPASDSAPDDAGLDLALGIVHDSSEDLDDLALEDAASDIDEPSDEESSSGSEDSDDSEEEPAQHPKLYRVRSTPVPPAE